LYIVVGAGEVGFYLAKFLTNENIDVVLVDTNENKLNRIRERLDVQTYLGHGASLQVLKNLDISNSEMVIAVTDLDEINMIVAMAAKNLGAKKTVARVRNLIYLSGTRFLYRDIVGIDYVLNPEVLSAVKLVDVVRTPGAVQVESFANDQVKIVRIPVTDKSPMANQKIMDFKIPSDIILGPISRKDEILIPRGKDMIYPGDQIYVISSLKNADEIRRCFTREKYPVKRVIINGGTTIGRMVAQGCAEHDIHVRIFDENLENCKRLEADLSDVEVIHGPGTDIELLQEEHISDFDVFMSVYDEDERNIVSGLLAKSLGVPKVAIIVRQSDFASIVSNLNVDVVISPRMVTADAIMKHIHRENLVSIASLENGKAEVIEIIPHPESPVINKTLQEIQFPWGCVVGTIQRGEDIIIPRGHTTILKKDHVIMFTLPEVIEDIERLFSA
jgi:trk system potassium uptake protein TrkA